MTAAPLSPALLGLLKPLSLLLGETSQPLAVQILQQAPHPFDEQTIRYKLADHAVRVWAAASLEREGKSAEAQTLRQLPPLDSAASATRAAAAVRGAVGLEAAAIAAEKAPIQGQDSEGAGFVGEQVAYVAFALAERFSEPADKRRIYDEAVELLSKLKAGR